MIALRAERFNPATLKRNDDPIETILVIHGTFGNPEYDAPHANRDTQWWQSNGSFCKALDRELENRGARARCWAHLPLPAYRLGQPSIHHERFAWSGANSEIARRYAGRLLARALRDLEMDSRVGRYHIVCHSHGGNVVTHALSGMVVMPQKLGRVFFLGTPFLTFKRTNPLRWAWLFWCVLSAAVAALAYDLFLHPHFDAGLAFPISFIAWLVLYWRARPRPVRIDGKDLGYSFRSEYDEAFHALRHSFEVRKQTGSVLRQILKERHPLLPRFRFGFKHQETWKDSLFQFAQEFQNTQDRFAPSSAPGVSLMPILNAVAPWVMIVPSLFGLAAILIYLIAVLPVALLSGIYRWITTLVTRFGLWYGLRSAAVSGLGDDLIGNRVLSVDELPSRFSVVPRALSADWEKEALAKANSSAGVIGNTLLQSFRGGSVTSMITNVSDTLSNADLVHAFYYQSDEICHEIAGLI